MTRVLPMVGLVGGFLLAPAPAISQQPLGDFLETVAELWAEGDARAIGAFSARSGTDLEIAGVSMGSLQGRKFSGALRRVFEDHVTVSVVANMTRAVHGVEDRAFGELIWEVRPAGATMSDSATVFLALVREPRGWRLTQIRILE